MKVNCIYNDPKNLPKNIPNNFDYGLDLHTKYLIMSILLCENKQLWYLVDENGRPSFFPCQIFKIIDNKMDLGYFNLIDWEDNVYPLNKKLIWGYYEICFDKNHYENIIDREEKALQIYFKRKEEILKAYEDGYYFFGTD